MYQCRNMPDKQVELDGKRKMKATLNTLTD